MSVPPFCPEKTNWCPFTDSAQFTFREEWWDPRLAYGRFADDETEVKNNYLVIFTIQTGAIFCGIGHQRAGRPESTDLGG